MKWLILFLLLPLPALAQTCTVTAASASQANVNAVINGPTHTAVDGDVICIPSGSATWSTGITVPTHIGITIIGSGTPNSGASTTAPSASCASGTNITVSSGIKAFSMSPQFGNSTSRISCMTITSGTGSGIALNILGTCTSSGCPNLRLDNITFASWAGHTNVGISFGITAIGDMFGSVDHNTINGSAGNFLQLAEWSNASFLGVGQYGDNSWAQAPGFGSANFLFFENNTFNNAGTTENEGTAGSLTNQGGGRAVVRFNTFNPTDNLNFVLGWHGTESNGRPRSSSFYEFYGNTWSCNSPTNGCPPLIGARGGTGMVWGNTLTETPGSTFVNVVNNTTYRTQGNPSAPWGPCDGSTAYDTNDGTTYYSGSITSGGGTTTVTVSGSPGWTTNQWVSNGSPYSLHDVTQGSGSEITANTANTITYASSGGPGQYSATNGDSIQILRATVCVDQAAGRGAGTLYSGATPASTAANQTLTPLYEWMDSSNNNPAFGVINTDTARTIANRDWYQESINQTAQTTTSAPFNGATGTGHGIGSRRPTTCTTGVAYWNTSEGGTWNNGAANSGALDLCTATNTWTNAYYTPYTYPHPLDGGSAPTTPTGLIPQGVVFQ